MIGKMKKWGQRSLSALDAGFPYIVIGISILSFFTFGAVTWVDSKSYIDIARELHGLDALRMFYSGSRIWYHNYVPLGLPLQWILLEKIPVEWVWPTVAIFNRALAAFALIYVTRSLQFVYRSPLIPLAGLFIALHPFYQAFQNAFLTEPPAMSLLLIGVGLAVRRVFGTASSSRWFIALILVIACAVFYRANVALILICIALAALLHLGKLFRPIALFPIGAFFLVFLSYPLFVAQVRGELILPRPGLSAIVEGIRINPKPSNDAITLASSYLPPGELDRLLKVGPDWASALALAERMRDSGVTNKELLNRIEAAGAALRDDTWQVKLRAWLVAGGAVGLPLDCRFAPSSYLSLRDLPVEEYCRLYFSWYDFHTWTGPRAQVHADWMRDFFTVAGREDLQRYRDAWTPYVSEDLIILRDPLSLRSIPIDFFTWAFLISSFVLLFRQPWLGFAMIGIFAGNWIMYASVPFGGARYVYPLFPLYVFALPLAWLAWWSAPGKSPHRYIHEKIMHNLPGRLRKPKPPE